MSEVCDGSYSQCNVNEGMFLVRLTRCQFSTFEQCQEWLKRLNAMARPPSRLDDLFSFAFHESCMNVYASEKEQHGELCRPGTYPSVPTRLTSPRDKTPP